MLRKLIAGVAVGLLSIGLTQAANGATLILEYSADTVKPLGGAIPDTAPALPTGSNLTPNAGTNTNGTYGAPTFVASGANNGSGSKDHAYYNFNAFGVLGNSNVGGSALNTAGTAQGYTMEAYLRISSSLSRIENTGIGFSQGTSFENQFIAFTGGGALTSQTQTYNGVSFFETTVNINAIVPRDRFVHIVKVVDASTNLVKFYIDGVEVLSAASPVHSLVSVYADRGENYGNVGVAGREVKGVDYSLTRYYQGALSAAEVYNEYANVVPEPTALGVVFAAGTLLSARRARH